MDALLYLFKAVICIALLSGALGAWYVLWLGVQRLRGKR